MKKLILTTLFSLLLTASAQAYVLEAKAIKDLVNTIQNTKFTYKERGMIFGYETIQSCLYVSPELVVIKNYCYPAKPYPAKSYTVISQKYGMIDFYEETFSTGVKHDVRIDTFPDILKDYFSASMDTETIDSVNVNLEKLYDARYPACWSTNFAYEDGKPTYGCLYASVDNVTDLQKWYDETQVLTADKKAWDDLFKTIETSIKR